MGASRELARPDSEEDFEAMCCALYRLMWQDPGCVRVGNTGQEQFGVDILAHHGARSVGVQCKHYNKTRFTLSTVLADIRKADDARLEIDHLLFATTAPSNASLVRKIAELSNQRGRDGKFTVSVDFWEDISGHIRLHQEIGCAYLPDFPGSTIRKIQATGDAHFALYQEDRASTREFHANVMTGIAELLERQAVRPQADVTPASSGTEVDPRVATTLDIVRDYLRQGRSRDAEALLTSLGNPEDFRDAFSRFRWRTNHATASLIEGRYEDAADEFIAAFAIAPDNEKAHANRAHALLLKKLPNEALAACAESLRQFPDNELLWSVRVAALRLLDDPDPEHVLPEHIRERPDILFARAHLRLKRDDHSGAMDLMRQCLASDGASFEARRAFLAIALSWAATEPVAAHHGQLTAAQREALEEAVQHLEPIEQSLPAIQSDHASEEITNNAVTSLALLGQTARARAIAAVALRRHPLTEGLLRIRLSELAENADPDAIHALTDSRLHELPAAVLGFLAELSANCGNVPWNDRIVAAFESSDASPDQLRDVRVLAIHARWNSGQRGDAIEAISRHTNEHPGHTLAAIIRGQMLLRSGRAEEAERQATDSLTRLGANPDSPTVFLLASLLFDLRKFQEAGRLYERLLRTPGDDAITRHLLVCLVESDQRQRAKALLDQLPSTVRARPAFRRIQANLARSMGNWALMREILSEELKEHPGDIGVALGYVGALYRLNDENGLGTYLASDPTFKNSTPENEFEFAKYQGQHGLPFLAIARLYRLYRSHSGSVQIAGFYLSQLLISDRFAGLDPPVSIQPGTVVRLQGASETRVVAVDIDASIPSEAWPELVSASSSIARALIGLKLGDHVTLTGPVVDQEFLIIGIENLFTFIAGKAHQQVASAADPVGPLRSVRVIKDDGTPDIGMLLESARQRSEHVRTVFAAYRQNRFPISMLAKALGTDPVTLLLEWPFKEASLFVGIGTHEEREFARQLLRQQSNKYVIDLLTATELVQRNALPAVSKLLGRPLIPQTAREHLLLLRQQINVARPTATLGEQDGGLLWTDTPASYYEDRAAFLTRILENIDACCEVVPTAGPAQVSDMHRVLAGALDADTLDAMYLCLEHSAILLSEDAALRLLAPDAGIAASIGVQPVLMEACAAGLLTQDVHADAIHGKIASGHEFVSVAADDLVTFALRSPDKVADAVRSALDTFRKPTLELISGVRVACEFLAKIVQRVPVLTAVQYGLLVLDVLQDGRPDRSPAIHRVVANVMQQSLRSAERRLTPTEKRALAPLLRAPPRPIRPSTGMTIARAVHEILMACRPRF